MKISKNGKLEPCFSLCILAYNGNKTNILLFGINFKNVPNI
jgi:hypothetical protein